MFGRIAVRGRPARQTGRKLRVDKETRSQAATTIRCALAAAPKASAALTSAAVR